MDTDSEAILKDVENRDKRKIVLKNIAFALLEQCKGENLTIKELESVLETVRYYSAETTSPRRIKASMNSSERLRKKP